KQQQRTGSANQAKVYRSPKQERDWQIQEKWRITCASRCVLKCEQRSQCQSCGDHDRFDMMHEIRKNKPFVIERNQNEWSKHKASERVGKEPPLPGSPKNASQDGACRSASYGGKAGRENNGHPKIPPKLV